ncbi:transcriptional regulator, TetR family [Frankia torreyi]|uniref:Transcriptional regulator, TetR family n=1 Tax=Frankia torreyi TaxID=1856 RepID=A0A0D8BMQ7_9ACTN|nr:MULTISPECIES: TetR/AcrR family transcriptional regulator [Frankia]KJE25375.1 transcriptional regulator, TetR family [Frankia torreyi]KQM07809.1 transcriptional regulator, TetR family [Frankia sp. CpI1-P]
MSRQHTSADARMPARTAREVVEAKEQAMLAASRAIVELFIERGTNAFTIRELASHAGVSERSFYRYFPRKEDVVRPFLAAGAERIAAELAGRPPDEPLPTSLVRVWAGSWAATHVEQLRKLYRILRESEGFRAQWFQIMADSERLWAGAIAARLGIDPRSHQAALAGAVVSAAARLSTVEYGEAGDGEAGDGEAGGGEAGGGEAGGGEAPAELFAAALAMLGPTLFTAPDPRPR